MLSDKEKKRRQHEKELNSLRNKMGKNDILFRCKREKNRNSLTIPQKKTLYKRVSGFVNGKYEIVKKEIEVIPQILNILLSMKPLFSVSISKIRESQLKNLLK